MRVRGLLVVALSLAILAAPLLADAQQPGKVPRIGLLRTASPPADSRLEAFRQGLRELGYVEGQNIRIEYRWTEGKTERLADLVAELVQLKVDVIVTSGTPAILAAKNATATIPIVMAAVANPVDTGLVASLARPGGNVTGLADLTAEVTQKGMELLKEMIPGLSRVAVLWNPTNPGAAYTREEAQAAARALGLKLQSLEVRGPNELPKAFTAAAKGRVGGLIAVQDTFTLFHRTRIAQLAARHGLPAIYGSKGFVEAGGFMSYGTNQEDLFRRAATFVDKILKGAKPADLPVEQPTRFELVVNMKTAKALGLTIPPSVMVRADQVIQ